MAQLMRLGQLDRNRQTARLASFLEDQGAATKPYSRTFDKIKLWAATMGPTELISFR
jgi:hypothetical protein